VLIVVAGPSGTGKGTLVTALAAREPRLWVSVSATTRAPRPGEVDGRDYFFLDRARFEELIATDGLLEWFEVFGQLKGTPVGPVDEHLAAGDDVLLEIDVQGALKIRALRPDAVLVFVMPPDRAEQRRRIEARGTETAEEIEVRLGQAEAEEAFAPEFDHVVVNDDVERATAELAAILRASRHLA
jgi:guanylate kinase